MKQRHGRMDVHDGTRVGKMGSSSCFGMGPTQMGKTLAFGLFNYSYGPK
jgi:hypothetical protein